MKTCLDWKGLARSLGRYKYVLLVALAGAVFLLLPAGEPDPSPEPAEMRTDLFHTGAMEEKLERVLSQVEGAGKVTVALTLRESPRQIVAQDGSASEGDREIRRETSTVVLSSPGGGQEAVTLQQLGPVFRGAVVVCSGADSPGVRLALSEAVSALTGLGADKISIVKGK